MQRPSTTQIGPERTMLVRPHGRDFDVTTILVACIATCVFFAFVAMVALV